MDRVLIIGGRHDGMWINDPGDDWHRRIFVPECPVRLLDETIPAEVELEYHDYCREVLRTANARFVFYRQKDLSLDGAIARLFARYRAPE